MPANKRQSVASRNDDSDNNNNDACVGNNRTVTSAINNHTTCDDDNNDNGNNNNDNDNKSQKSQYQNVARFYRNNKKAGLVLVTLILVLQVVARIQIMNSNRKTSKVEELSASASASASGATIIRSTDNKSNNNNNAIDNYNKEQQYELYPFLVDSVSVTSSLSSASSASSASSWQSSATSKTATDVSFLLLLSKPTLPPFPIISRLESCTLAFVPSNPPRTIEAEWRPMFWIPSFPGSGASNPSKKGDLLRQLIEGLFTGDKISRAAGATATANANATTYKYKYKSYGKPVKDFHVSLKGKRKRLKRCIGISETIGCTNNHPMVATKPEALQKYFRREVILPIRNPATVIPEYFTNKQIAYHKATKQGSVEEWRQLRDAFFEDSFREWMELIRYWRGSSGSSSNSNSTSTSKESSSYYRTVLYVPFEDLVTSDAAKGTAVVQRLANLLNGNGSNSNSAPPPPPDANANANANANAFETTQSRDDFECLWYRTAKHEWEREQQTIGDYIPAYTKQQQNTMIHNLTVFANEIELEIGILIEQQQQQQQQQHKSSGGSGGGGGDASAASAADSVLLSLLRRYAYQIEQYVAID